MSTVELTKKIESLSAEDYEIVVMLIERLSKGDDDFKKLGSDELVEELIRSADKSDLGYTNSARVVSEKMRNKYAV